MNEDELKQIESDYARLGDEDANVIHRLAAEVRRLNQMIADAGDMAAEIRRAQRAEDFAKSENARLRAALELAKPFLRDDIINPDNCNCAYCDDEEGNHKDDCKQLLAYLACTEALKGGEG